ncbi:hypothetical protein J3459_015960 [Metarhizium acridum]|nr:hypothetical protein J3458_021403 [Metarhizium acridum]KAG8412473.1 hypothetical protein J3459_015960 [Metarhizium acridum]
MADSAISHGFKNLFLLFLSILILPFSTIAVLIATCLPSFHHDRETRATDPKTILVTGVSMSKGLAIARHLHRQGHTVIGADCHRLSAGRVSRAIRTFHVLPKLQHGAVTGATEMDPYTARLLHIVLTEHIDLWISASDVNGAIQDGLAKEAVENFTPAKVIQLGHKEVATLDDKSTFIEYVKFLGLLVPDTQYVGSRAELESFLRARQGLSLSSRGKQYLVKPIGVNDVARFSMPLLPCLTEKETMARIDAISFKSGSNFIVQEYIRGDEFCTHSLVIKGNVRAFVACPSSELLMHYTALPHQSTLSNAMLDFTRRVVEANGKSWTGHLSFDFIVPYKHDNDRISATPRVYPIECNPRAHTAVLLFNQTSELADEYLSVLNDGGGHRESPIYPMQPQKVYWIGQDLVEQVLYPALEILLLHTRSFYQFAKGLSEFREHVIGWKDGVFELWDPFPFWWLYHIQWPVIFLKHLFKGRWHRANVSTGKLFRST